MLSRLSAGRGKISDTIVFMIDLLQACVFIVCLCLLPIKLMATRMFVKFMSYLVMQDRTRQ